MTLPEPYSHLIGIPIYTPYQGRGWIGYEQRGAEVVIWHVTDLGTASPVDFDRIHVYEDPMTGNTWMIFVREADDYALPVILYADEAKATFYVPWVVQRMTGGKSG